jgi:hypothetical protein
VTPARVRLISMAAIVAGAGLAALSWSQPWYTVDDVVVGGDVAGAAVLPLALASLTLLLALALAGPVFRVILGVLDALLGVCVVVVAVWSLSDPVRASQPALVEATGMQSEAPLTLMPVTTTPWPAVGIVAGALMIATGLFIAVTARRWPVSGSRYARTRLETPEGDAVHDWDALSDGDDPTTDPR